MFCHANCSHAANALLAMHGIDLAKCQTSSHSETLYARQLIQGSGPQFICIPCHRAQLNFGMMPTWKKLEAELLEKDETAMMWTSMARFKVVVEEYEWKCMWAMMMAKAKVSAYVGVMRGGVIGADMSYMESFGVDELGGLLETNAELDEDAKVDDVMREMGFMGVGGQGEAMDDMLKMFGGKK